MSFDDFEREVCAACSGADAWRTPPQVEYLRSYLTHGPLAAQTLLIESPYVDRHYIEEYSAYYSTAFRTPRSYTSRLHIFEARFGPEELETWIHDAAANGDPDALRKRLQDTYLGFATIRPIPDAPIGRTVLCPYPERPSRVFTPASIKHRVHLLGVTLRVPALPFQQQEQAVGACATTAIWSSLARVARSDGGRAPTPYSVTLAATRNFIQNRPLPAAGGLDLSQITAAVREFEYAPHVLKPSGQVGSFLMALKTYVASGIPPVLVLQEAGGDAHAVAVAGIREDDDDEPAREIEIKAGKYGLALRSAGMSRIYVHDDRLGPYVRMEFIVSEEGELSLRRLPYGHESQDGYEPMSVWFAIFPLYPKLRFTARELINVAGDTAPFLRKLLGPDSWELCRISARFTLNGQYLSELLSLGLDPGRTSSFLKAAALSRYVGVLRIFMGDEILVDLLCDTTDIGREQPPSSAILAIVPFHEDHKPGFEIYAERYTRNALVF